MIHSFAGGWTTLPREGCDSGNELILVAATPKKYCHNLSSGHVARSSGSNERIELVKHSTCKREMRIFCIGTAENI